MRSIARTEKNPDARLVDQPSFAPPREFVSRALISDAAVYEEADREHEAYWADRAAALEWMNPWEKVLDWRPPWAQWFVGGKLNASVNCLDRHVISGHGDRIAYRWEGEDGSRRAISYAELLRDVCRCANALKSLGVGRGDVVGIYMGMIPEAIVTMLACARIGAVHNVVFGGFSPQAMAERMGVADARVLVTADGSFRRGVAIALKTGVDRVVQSCPALRDVVVVRRTGEHVDMMDGRDHWWHDLMAVSADECLPAEQDSEDPLFILYTSGSTAKPKGVVHTTGGYLTGVLATQMEVFDRKDDDVYWCTADIGWVTGHSYIVYGPLAAGISSVIYEGAPDYPDKDRWWSIVERYGVTVLYTAPTAIRTAMKWGDKYPETHDLSSLRLLGSVGEPINPAAWLWYRSRIGKERCPIVDTWWQTETGMQMIAPLPGVLPTKPGSATKPLPGVSAAVLDAQGNKVTGVTGKLVIDRPWPAMLRTLYKEPERYVETYWSRFGPGTYVTGDLAVVDEDGYFWLLGRDDDVMNVSGHRISTMEVESALVSHPGVVEAAVVGAPDEHTGEEIVAFVTLAGDAEPGDDLAARLREEVAQEIGKHARPKRIVWALDLPKTRSGKIMRRLLRNIAAGEELGDVTTLLDPAVMEKLKERVLSDDPNGVE